MFRNYLLLFIMFYNESIADSSDVGALFIIIS